MHWHVMAPPLGARQLRLGRARRVLALARRLHPDVVIERYYNFGGEGLRAARRTGALAVLEVNAPMIDHAGSLKRRLDRALIVEPFRRWRDWQAAVADLVVTPTATILPDGVPRERVGRDGVGADVGRFRPDACGPAPFVDELHDTIVVFAGAFRRWHGAVHLVRALARLRAEGRRDITAVLIGAGPELRATRAEATTLDGVVFTGAVPHERMPGYLAAAHIGAAPFDLGAHAPLGIDFFWSPLKVFEYMASGLPSWRRVFRGSSDWWATAASSTIRQTRPPSRGRSRTWRTRNDGRSWARRPGRGWSSTSAGEAHCRRLDAAIAQGLSRR